MLINFLQVTIRINQSEDPVKGKIYFTTNKQPNWSEERVYRILVNNDGEFHTHNFYIGAYFNFQDDEKLTHLLFVPTVENKEVNLTLKSIKLLF